MRWKLLQWVGAFLTLSSLALWLMHGAHVFTQQRHMRVYREADPIFGTERERVEWVPGLRLGLDILGPLAAAGLGLWVWGWWRQRRRQS